MNHSKKVLQIISSYDILNFLERFKKQQYQIPRLGFHFSKLNVPVVRSFLNIPDNEKNGILIDKVYDFGTGSDILMKNDILLELSDYKINSSGFYSDKKQGQILFTNIFNNFKSGQTINAKILRKGEYKNLEITIKSFSTEDLPIPHYHLNKKLDYFLFAGLVFFELSVDLIHHIKNQEYFPFLDPFIKKYYNKYNFNNFPGDKRRLIVVSSIIPDKINEGFHDFYSAILKDINNYCPLDLNDMKNYLNKNRDKHNFYTFSFEDFNGEIIIPTDKRLDEANTRISKNYLN